MTTVKLGKQEAERVATFLVKFKDYLDTVFVDVSSGKFRVYGSNQGSTVLFAMATDVLYTDSENAPLVCLDAKQLTRSLQKLDDLLGDAVASIQFEIGTHETTMIVEKNPGIVKRRFTNHAAQPSISPKTVQSFLQSPISLKDWQFVKSGLAATLDAADEGDILIRTGNNRVTFLVRGQVSSGEVSTEYVGPDVPHEVIVDKAFLVNAFSQQSTYPPDAVSMTISDDMPVVVDFNDSVTRLTVALSPRIE